MSAAAERIVLDHVDMRFTTDRGPLSVVDDVSLSVREGEFVALVGPSGCGKTTLLNMMAGFLTPTGGTVTLDGSPIRGPGRERGVMFQEYGVFPWLTVKENIAFGLKLGANRVPQAERDAICDRYMELMRLTDFRNSYPKTLSGGMRQRVALARAYAVNPAFLLMDEPFGALDAQTRSAMQDLLLEVLERENKTVVMITHSVDEALYLASRIVVISARPARIRRIIDVPFGYPRQDDIHTRPEFAALRSEIKDLVMREYAAQEKQARLRLSD
ncbi:MAG: ABC transporter ATP-binding protein [Rhizobiaceae bacterium]|nr:ABC transporter ATP-binding protein [Rhizobiaceae bacterium]MCV0407411.1 ABC transporter ATP-binding protein [Rhizobiaceae bacterium]